MEDKFKILDVVALQSDINDKGLSKGNVGTIVEILGERIFLVEFSGYDGKAYAIEEVNDDLLLKLHFQNQLAVA